MKNLKAVYNSKEKVSKKIIKIKKYSRLIV